MSGAHPQSMMLLGVHVCGVARADCAVCWCPCCLDGAVERTRFHMRTPLLMAKSICPRPLSGIPALQQRRLSRRMARIAGATASPSAPPAPEPRPRRPAPIETSTTWRRTPRARRTGRRYRARCCARRRCRDGGPGTSSTSMPRRRRTPERKLVRKTSLCSVRRRSASLSALVLQVDRGRVLAPVEDVVQVPRAPLGRRNSPHRAAPHDVAVLRVLDLDHVGAPVRQDAPGERHDTVRRHVHDAKSLEHVHWPSPSDGRP